jgi:hypothetical protein
MQELIEKYTLQKDQIAGRVLELEIEGYEMEFKTDRSEEIKTLDMQANLWDAMIELAQAFDKLQKNG